MTAGGSEARPATELYLKGIPESFASEEEVEKFFAKFGEVTQVELDGQGSALVTFAEGADYDGAMEEILLMPGCSVEMTEVQGNASKRRRLDDLSAGEDGTIVIDQDDEIEGYMTGLAVADDVGDDQEEFADDQDDANACVVESWEEVEEQGADSDEEREWEAMEREWEAMEEFYDRRPADEMDEEPQDLDEGLEDEMEAQDDGEADDGQEQKPRTIPPRMPWRRTLSAGKEKSNISLGVEPKKLFVARVPKNAQEDDLVEYFGHYGEVAEVSIKKHGNGDSTGMGYVLFTEEESATSALKDFGKHSVHGQMFEVMAFGRFGLEENGPFYKDRLFVSGFNQSTNIDDVREYFSQYGDIVKLSPKFERGFAFLQFASPGAVQLALQHYSRHKIGDKWIEAKPVVAGKGENGGGKGEKAFDKGFGKGDKGFGKGGKDWDQGYGKGARRPKDDYISWNSGAVEKEQTHVDRSEVFVGGLPKNMVSQGDGAIWKYFEHYGKIRSVKLQRGYCFVTFDSDRPVRKVLEDFDRHRIEGQWVECRASGRFSVPHACPIIKDRIFIGALPEGCTQKAAWTYFENYGPVSGVELKRGYGFIQFKSGSSVQLALWDHAHHKFEGKWIDVQPCVDQQVMKGLAAKGALKGEKGKFGEKGKGSDKGKSGEKGPSRAASWPPEKGGHDEGGRWGKGKSGSGRGYSESLAALPGRHSRDDWGEAKGHSWDHKGGKDAGKDKSGGSYSWWEKGSEGKGKWSDGPSRSGAYEGPPRGEKGGSKGDKAAPRTVAPPSSSRSSYTGTSSSSSAPADQSSWGQGGNKSSASAGKGSAESPPVPSSRHGWEADRGRWDHDKGSQKGSGGGGPSMSDAPWAKPNHDGPRVIPSPFKKDTAAQGATVSSSAAPKPTPSRSASGGSSSTSAAPSKDPVAQPKSRQAQDIDPESIYVGGCAKETNEKAIEKYFGQYGSVQQVDLKRDEHGVSKGFAFVTLSSEKQVRAVLMDYDEHTIEGRDVECLACGKFGLKEYGPQDKKKVFVGGTPHDVTEKTLETHFSKYGGVDEVLLRTGFAFVTFRTGAGVQLALHAYNNHFIDGKWVQVQPMVIGKGKGKGKGGGGSEKGKAGDKGGGVPAQPHHPLFPPPGRKGKGDDKGWGKGGDRDWGKDDWRSSADRGKSQDWGKGADRGKGSDWGRSSDWGKGSDWGGDRPWRSKPY